MRKIWLNITLLLALFLLWGCPATTTQVEWGEVVYAPCAATGFEIVATEGASTVVRVLSPWQGAEGVVKEIFVSRNGESAPDGFGGTTIEAAPERVVCMSSSHIAFVDARGAVERTCGVSGAEYISNSHIAEGIAEERRLVAERMAALSENTWNREKLRTYAEFSRAYESLSPAAGILIG